MPEGARVALDAWNLMGGEVKWDALDFVVERFGVTDVETLVHQLCAFRNHFQAKASEQNE